MKLCSSLTYRGQVRRLRGLAGTALRAYGMAQVIPHVAERLKGWVYWGHSRHRSYGFTTLKRSNVLTFKRSSGG